MKLLILSDLHTEFAPFEAPTDVAYDAVVLAGDIHAPGSKAVQWAKRDSTFGGKPVLFVPGNHEFYGAEIARELQAMRDAAQGSHVHVLDRGAVLIDGVRFLGTTLWTDFRLPIQTAAAGHQVDVARALHDANRRLNDFRRIAFEDPLRENSSTPGDQRRLLRAEDIVTLHQVNRTWLERELAQAHPGPVVVVTHHAPASGSVAEQFAADWLSPAFVSDLQPSFFVGPSLWVHGHTHASSDYRRGTCRIVCNPRGYPMRHGGFENRTFDRSFVVEVTADR